MCFIVRMKNIYHLLLVLLKTNHPVKKSSTTCLHVQVVHDMITSNWEQLYQHFLNIAKESYMQWIMLQQAMVGLFGHFIQNGFKDTSYT